MKKLKSVLPDQKFYHVVWIADDEALLEIGVFSSRRLATDVVKTLKTKMGFKDSKGRFHISRGVTDVVGWQEGFISAEEYLDSLK